MKILFVTSSLSVGGSSKIICDLAIFFKKKLNEVIVVSFRDNATDDYKCELKKNDIRYISLGRKNKFDFSFIHKFRGLIKEIQPDVISSHLSATFYYPLYGFKKHYFHTIHSKPSLDINRFVFLFLKKYIKRNTLHLVACSYSIQNEALKTFKVPVSVAQNGIQMNKTLNNSCVPSIDFLFVGRFDPCKRVNLLIESFEKCLKFNSNLNLTLCGHGPELNSIVDLVNKKHIENNVVFVTNQNNPDSLYKKSKIFCLFSEREGGPIVLLEAINYGLPIICSNIPGNLNFVTPNKNADIFSSSNADDIGLLMYNLISDKKRMHQYSMYSSKNKMDFSIDKTAERYLNLFNEYRK